MNILDFWAMKLPGRKRMNDQVTAKYYHDYFKELRGKNILEIGCGHGYGARAINKYFSPNRIVATDLDPRMIKSAKKTSNDPTIVFEIADAARLPFKNNSFDAAFVFGALHHIPAPDWQTSIKELSRVLTSKGLVFIYDNSRETFKTLFGSKVLGRIYRSFNTHPYNSMYTVSEFKKYLKIAGFRILKEADAGKFFMVIAKKKI